MTERVLQEPRQVSDAVSTALVPLLKPEHFGHVTQEYRGKVARDLVAHLTGDRRWNYETFNALNDYQRHLYALFLRLADIPFRTIWARLWNISVDVSEAQRYRYVDDVLYSGIVGFPAPDFVTREPLGVAP